MDRGKRLCKALKELRKRIADANGIRYEIEECTHQGRCPGTCPKCEAEVRYIENELSKKAERGEPVNRQDMMSDEELRRLVLQDIDDTDSESETTMLRGDIAAPEAPEPEDIVIEGIATLPKPKAKAKRPDAEGMMVSPHGHKIIGGVIYPDYSNERLGTAVLEKLLDTCRGDNLVFSPSGVGVILQMLKSAVRRGSKPYRAIKALLGQFDHKTLRDLNSGSVTFEQANGMWYDQRIGSLKKSFQTKMARQFGATPQEVDFSQVSDVQALIDNWANEHTQGLIKKVNLKVTPYSFLILANVLYLKAQWTEPFDADLTRTRIFHNADGTTSRVWMMQVKSNLTFYKSNSDYQAVRLFYDDYDYTMTIYLPTTGTDINDVMCNPENLHSYDFIERPTDLTLPKLKLDANIDFEDPLSALGLTGLFKDEYALPNITDEPAHVGKIGQECVLSVDEQGTEAAAVTHAECEVGCAPPANEPRYHRVVVDRPFGFVIRHYDGPILFMGIVNQLENVSDADDDNEVEHPMIKQKLTSITVAGTSHIKNIDDVADEIYEGVALTMKRDIGNKYDSKAIALYIGDQRVGFVPRQKNEIIANLLDANVPLIAVVTEAEWQGSWFSIKADIGMI